MGHDYNNIAKQPRQSSFLETWKPTWEVRIGLGGRELSVREVATLSGDALSWRDQRYQEGQTTMDCTAFKIIRGWGETPSGCARQFQSHLTPPLCIPTTLSGKTRPQRRHFKTRWLFLPWTKHEYLSLPSSFIYLKPIKLPTSSTSSAIWNSILCCWSSSVF